MAQASQIEWTDARAANVWIGVSVENQQYTHRIADLRRVPASVRFLSLEPLIGPIHILPLRGIHWVIAGGESGPRSRSVKAEWIREIRDQCVHDLVPFFFKQWGGVRKSRTGRVLDGKTWDEFPAVVSQPNSQNLKDRRLKPFSYPFEKISPRK